MSERIPMVHVHLSIPQARAMLAALRLLGQGLAELPEADVAPLTRGLEKLTAEYQKAIDKAPEPEGALT